MLSSAPGSAASMSPVMSAVSRYVPRTTMVTIVSRHRERN
jgi:hypothetical protein